MLTAKEAQIKTLLSEGERWNVIAKTLHVSKRTILKVSKRMNEETSIVPASEVFKMFEENKSPADIVKEFNADPETMEKWLNVWLRSNKTWREWQDMARAHEKDGKEVEKVEKKPPFLKDPRGFLRGRN